MWKQNEGLNKYLEYITMKKKLLIIGRCFCSVIMACMLAVSAMGDHTVGSNEPVAEAEVSDILEAARRAIRLKDYSEAASLYRSLALEGDADAMYQLGVLFQMGRGVSKNHTKAVGWYEKAAAQGHMKAQFNLGTMYESGWGTTPDYKMAYDCYRKAAAQGHDRAESKCNMLRDGGLLMLGNTDLSKEELLIATVKKNDLNNIIQLLNLGADIDYQDKYGNTPMIESGVCDHIEAARLLISKGVCLEIHNKEGDNVLLIVVQKGNLEIAKELLVAGANINSSNSCGCTPLMIASKSNDSSMVQLLLDHNADVRKLDDQGRDALYYALNKGNGEVAGILIATGKVVLPSYDKRGQEVLEKIAVRLRKTQETEKHDKAEVVNVFEGWTPLMISAWRGEVDIVRLLLSQGDDVNVSDRDGHTALSRASWKGYLDIVGLLLLAGAEVVIDNDAADTLPIVLAAKYGHDEVVLKLVKRFVAKNGPINLLDETFYTASGQWYEEIAETIVDAGVDFKIEDDGQLSSLLLLRAVSKRKGKLVVVFLEYGADINTTNEAGKTALMLAAESGYRDIVTYLIKMEAGLNLQDEQGNTALFLAAHAGNPEIVSLLISAGSDMQIKSNYGNTPLILAADAGHDEIVELLIDQGMEVDVVNRSGYNALLVAMKRSDRDMARVLLDSGARPYVPKSKQDEVDAEMDDLLKEYWTIKNLSSELFSKRWGN